MVMDTQLCEFTKTIAHFQWVNCTVCELELSKTPKSLV